MPTEVVYGARRWQIRKGDIILFLYCSSPRVYSARRLRTLLYKRRKSRGRLSSSLRSYTVRVYICTILSLSLSLKFERAFKNLYSANCLSYLSFPYGFFSFSNFVRPSRCGSGRVKTLGSEFITFSERNLQLKCVKIKRIFFLSE